MHARNRCGFKLRDLREIGMIPAFRRQQIEHEPMGNRDDHLFGRDRLARTKDDTNGAILLPSRDDRRPPAGGRSRRAPPASLSVVRHKACRAARSGSGPASRRGWQEIRRQRPFAHWRRRCDRASRSRNLRARGSRSVRPRNAAVDVVQARSRNRPPGSCFASLMPAPASLGRSPKRSRTER